jgi:hypothetical protein
MERISKFEEEENGGEKTKNIGRTQPEEEDEEIEEVKQHVT